ncbi:hypothetical protein BB561_004081 [Smittium simulii]|uniref:RRM domain-containing protein n=1 Tax=Smittium simulii TaxID=133385 RepID=A0A2T9YI81_9FUNG|nr:hypothetical protein BB561_004081 [Smittium simulii]
MTSEVTSSQNAEAPIYNNDQKVFVGNLSFSTTDQTLTEEFNKVAKVKDAHVVTRGRRSLGYGFVVFEEDVNVDSAINSLKSLTIGGREINIEAARTIAKTEKVSSRFNARPKKPVNKSKDAYFKENSEEPDNGSRTGPRRFRGASRFARPQRRADAALSDTVIFVSNLPFSVKDEDLKELFKDFKIAEARVAVRTLFNKSTRSKGFGFVTFESHEEQTRALDNFAANPISINDRQLTLKRSFELLLVQ